MNETGEELRIVAVPVRFAEQTLERPRRLTDVRLEVGVELVRDRQPRVERERTAKRFLGARLAARCDVDVLADDAVAASEPGPGRGEARIDLQTLLVRSRAPASPS